VALAAANVDVGGAFTGPQPESKQHTADDELITLV
jgi:hypothetical protein